MACYRWLMPEKKATAEYIWGALNSLKVSRIDHGVRCVEDQELVDYLLEKANTLDRMPLVQYQIMCF